MIALVSVNVNTLFSHSLLLKYFIINIEHLFSFIFLIDYLFSWTQKEGKSIFQDSPSFILDKFQLSSRNFFTYFWTKLPVFHHLILSLILRLFLHGLYKFYYYILLFRCSWNLLFRSVNTRIRSGCLRYR